MKPMRILALVSMLIAVCVPATASDGPLGTVKGTVAAMDASAGLLVIKLDPNQGDRTGEMSFFVSGEAKIVRAGETIALIEVLKGDRVTITYRSTDTRNVVVNMGVESNKT